MNNVKLPPFKVTEVVSTLSETAQWGVTKLNVPETWKVTQGEDITIMVIDTGFTNHKDLFGCMIESKSKNYISGEGIEDENGHSTHCCGIIGARQNDYGCVGVAPKCNIITVKVLGKDGTGSIDGIVAALDYAFEIKPDVVSMSLGCPNSDPNLYRAIKKLYDNNIPVIAAAGNEGGADRKQDTVNYPAKYSPEVIAVASMNEDGTISNFSSWGEKVDITAPGAQIYSTWLNNNFAKLSGTSMATPFVAAIVALLLAKHRKQEKETGMNDCKTVDQIREHLIKYADDKGMVGHDNSFGYGVVNPFKLIFETSSNPPPLPKPKRPTFWEWLKMLLDL